MSKRKRETEPAIVSADTPPDEPAKQVDDVIPIMLEPRTYEIGIDVTQAEFDQALYGLGFDGAETYEMWQTFNQMGSVNIRLKKP